jgi:hypothetical protein
MSRSHSNTTFSERHKSVSSHVIEGDELAQQLAIAMDPKKVAKLRRKRQFRIVQRLIWRYRRQWGPVLLLAATWITGSILHHVENGARTSVVVGFTGLGVLWLMSRRWIQSATDRKLVVIYAAGLVTWLSFAAAIGTESPMPAMLLIGGTIGALPWWRRYAIRGDSGQPRGAELIRAKWNELVGADGGVLPGSYLVNVERVQNGWQSTIQLRPGKHETTDAITALGKITSAYNTSMGSVVIEAMPDGNASRASMLLLEHNPLRSAQLWSGPQIDLETGIAPVGVHADDTEALWRWWMPGSGAVHSLVSGTTGSGKSRFLDLLIASAAHCGLIVPWVIDPQYGQSLPFWVNNVDWAATTAQEAKRMLRTAVAIMNDRSKRFATMHWTDDKGRILVGKHFFDPTPQIPLIHIWVEEAHEILSDDEARVLIERIAKLGRKTGIGLTLVTQVPSVAELGGSSVIREMLASGNVAVFRTASRLTGQMAFQGVLPVEPHTLPREFPDGSSTGGLGFILGPSIRTTPQRAFYVEDPYYWATTACFPRLEQAAELAGGVDYASRHDRHDDTEPVSPAQYSRIPLQASKENRHPDISVTDAILDALRTQPDGMERGQIIYTVQRTVGYSLRWITDALKKLVDASVVEKSARGLYSLPNSERER